MESIREFGVGTERVVSEVEKLFPSARVLRMDSDTRRRVGDHARILTEFGERADILVGTQMVAKGLDFPTVTLVGVVAADVGLHVPDFRASERSFDVIAQVCGRSGRARPGARSTAAFRVISNGVGAGGIEGCVTIAGVSPLRRPAASWTVSRGLRITRRARGSRAG